MLLTTITTLVVSTIGVRTNDIIIKTIANILELIPFKLTSTANGKNVIMMGAIWTNVTALSFEKFFPSSFGSGHQETGAYSINLFTSVI
jgi:hypothetical protein